MTDHFGIDTKTYSAKVGGHVVELEFDKKLLVINRAKLFVDGQEVDSTQVFYGDKELSTDLADGTKVEVAIDSGATGELTRAQVRQADGSWTDLEEQQAA